MRLASLTFATLALLATSATAEPVRLTSTELDGVTGGLYRDVGIIPTLRYFDSPGL
jgi:hypothetical protein